jgi:hypothetical protein
MNKEQLLGIVRHSLTFVGGLLVMYGIGDASSWADVVGSAVALAGAVWSVAVKNPETVG